MQWPPLLLKVLLLLAILVDVAVLGQLTGGMLYPQESESRELKDLNGIWTFKQDVENQGMINKWWLQPLTPPVIAMPVPASYNDITQDNALRRHIGLVWYEREFWVSKGWQGQRIVLRFESVSYAATVWLNTVQIAEHEGGHLPFEADITDRVIFGSPNRVLVAVNNTLTPYSLPPGDLVTYYNNTNYPNGYTKLETHFDFYNYAGIDREVFLYTTPKQWIDDITITYNVPKDGDLDVLYNISVSGQKEGASPYLFAISLLDSNGKIVAKNSGSLTGTLTISKGDVHLWQPGNPYLYTLEVMTDNDVYRLRSVGIRTIKVTNTQFLINDKPFYFYGVDKHEDSDIRGKGLDNVIVVKDYNMLQWLNVSAYRTSHYPYATQFYDMADRLGIVIIDECPAVGLAKAEYFNAKTLAHHKQVLFEMIRRDKNHPSVVMWSTANEPQSDLKEAQDYFKEVARYTREIDPTKRPITLVQAIHSANDKTCMEYFDVACINRYYGWYDDTGQLELIQLQLEQNIKQWFEKYNMPVLVSEYGADTVPGFHHDPPFVFTEDFQVAFLQQYHQVFNRAMNKYLIGELIWNFADFRTAQGTTRVGASNLKGILTRQRQPKAAAHLIRARYSYLRQMWEYDSTKELMSMQDRALSLEKAKQHSGH